MYDLKKIEENFHKLICEFIFKNPLEREGYQFPKLTEELLTHEDFTRVPGMYGGFFYYLKIENGKPVLYANASSRMDLDELYIVDEESYKWIKNGNYYEELNKNKIEDYNG